MLWWLEATRWDGFTGYPGRPEWPEPGGMLRQAAVVVEAVSLLREEWQLVSKKAQAEQRQHKDVKLRGH